MIVMELQPIKGDCQIAGYNDYITLDDVSWEITREPKESFNRGGTDDLNFGIAEAGAVNVKKAMDISSVHLMKAATGGGASPATCKILFLESGADQAKYVPFLEIQLERPVVKKWSIDGSGDERPTENIELLYNKIKMKYYTFHPKKGDSGWKGWDLVKGEAVES